MRISWCLGLLLASAFMVVSESNAEQVPRPMTDYCNRANALYADGSNENGPFPMLKCTQNSLTYQRSPMAFPLPIVTNGRFSKSNANAACGSANEHGADAIVENVQSLCNLELWPGSCTSCNTR